MRIAIPIWEDKVSPVLDTASRLLIVVVEDLVELSRFEIFLDEYALSRKCLSIRDMNVGILICGAISRTFSRMLISSGIDIIPEISGNPEEVLKAYLKGNLLHSRFMMPGCKRYNLKQRRCPLPSEKPQRRWKKGNGRGFQT